MRGLIFLNFEMVWILVYPESLSCILETLSDPFTAGKKIFFESSVSSS